MIVSKDMITKVKDELSEYNDVCLNIKANIGRNKCKETSGVVDKVYSNVFVIKENETGNNLTYSYTDVITQTLELMDHEGEKIANFDFSTPKYMRL